MGQEINSSQFSQQDSQTFRQRLINETRCLAQQLDEGVFASDPLVGGFEIETWLVDQHAQPVANNEDFLHRFQNELASPELARFNIELNNHPTNLKGKAFSSFAQDLDAIFTDADRCAQSMNTRLIMVGILPTATPELFCLENMSALNRYRALNEQILHARKHAPISLDIAAQDHLQMSYDSVMMEAATTSFQIHTQVPWQHAHHYYNASLAASAATLAVSANAPFLFEQELWDETRIPLFEQSVNIGGSAPPRVTFGHGYAQHSILQCFEENLHRYPVLLPTLFDDPREAYSHLRLHNGVIWRWNRPLIGFNQDGTPHIRIEHRVMPAGPTLRDMLANAAFYYGLSHALSQQLRQGKPMPVDFKQAEINFYAAAKSGLKARAHWQAKEQPLQTLILDTFLPLAKRGLQQLDIDAEDITSHLGIIEARTCSGQTGAQWQRQHLKTVGGDMQRLTLDYFHLQHTGRPVHTWE
ncbi:MAG: glutamate--cysteine ligase [bacterium]